MFQMNNQDWYTWLSGQSVPVTNGVITAEHGSQTADTSLTLLGHEQLLTFSGKENRKFLQGQLTCDVDKLADGQFTYGACCSPKGRMIANFRVDALGDDLTLILPTPQGDALKAHIGKYAAFFRTVKIEDTSEQWVRLALSGPQAASIIKEISGQPAPADSTFSTFEHGLALKASSHAPRYELWIKPEQAEGVWVKLTDKCRIVPTIQWKLEDIQEGLCWVTEETREAWIPQHLNWQAIGGISFTKGCYTGQEIVARMKYLGKLKSRLYRLTLEGTEAPAVNAAVLNAAGKKSGDIVAALASDSVTECLAVLRNDDTEGALTLEDGQALTLQALPYSLDED